MSQPLFNIGEIVIADFPGSEHHGKEFQIMKREYGEYGKHFSHGFTLGTCKREGWWYDLDGTLVGPECQLRKKYDGAGDFHQMMEDLKQPYHEESHKEFFEGEIRLRLGPFLEKPLRPN